jgi:choline dehydrogenase
MMRDVLIVGGGSAGCVLANRLTECGTLNVLLIEAGPDYTEQTMPQEIRESAFSPASHDWGYTSQPDHLGISVVIPRGKVIGGSSSVNYCFAMRGRPADHDNWAALGNDGWGYEDVLPFYRRMESYAYGDDCWHGRVGPYKLDCFDWDQLEPTAAAAALASDALGYARVPDVNAPGEPGFARAPLSAVGGIRQSTALTYLEAARSRPNLTVRGGAEVDRVLFDGDRAIGVRLVGGEMIKANHVILSAGTYNSPAILMRSGVGPQAHLDELGIEVVKSSPGVGQNLTEHPVMWNIYAAKAPERVVSAMFQTALSVKSDDSLVDYDLHVLPTAAVPTELMPRAFVPPADEHPTGWDFVFFVSCMQPKSRGSVRLASSNPKDAPLIDLGLYRDSDDVKRVTKAVRIARQLAETSPLSDLLASELTPGRHVSDAKLEQAVRAAPSHYNHAASTCRMGPATDPMAVVDNRCEVHGLKDLFVVDASVMPSICRVPTNPTTILIAERVSDWLLPRFREQLSAARDAHEIKETADR